MGGFARGLACIGAVLTLLAQPVEAQDPPLRPLREYLESAGTSPDLGTMRYIFRRCSALDAILVRLTGDRGQRELQETSERRGTMFLAVAVELEKRMGTASEAEAERATLAAIESIGEILIERMNNNMALTGSYFAEDPLLGGDVRVCQSLAEPIER